MNTRLEHEAADALMNLEGWVAFKAGERARWERVKASAKPIAGTWAPTMTEQQKQEREQQIAEHALPF